MIVTARFSVTGFDPRELPGLGDWVDGITMTKTFTAGIIGESTALFVTSGAEGTRSYLAVERITGTPDDGRSGSVTVHHGGLESDPSTWFGHIVPHSGTGGFAEWAGLAQIQHDDEGAFFVLDVL